jgi:hypothetical protein
MLVAGHAHSCRDNRRQTSHRVHLSNLIYLSILHSFDSVFIMIADDGQRALIKVPYYVLKSIGSKITARLNWDRSDLFGPSFWS